MNRGARAASALYLAGLPSTSPSMRLLALTHSLSDIDGVGVYGAEVLKRLAPKYESIEVLIARKHRGISARLPSSVKVDVALPPDYLLRLSWPKFAWYCATRLPRVLAAARRADLVHSLSDYPHALLAVMAARRAGKPVVISGHGTYSVAPFDLRGHRGLIRWAYSKADAVLMGSRFALSRLEEKVALPCARVVHYGVDPAPYAAASAAAPDPRFAGRRYVITIGEVKERKGHHISIPAFLSIAARHPDVDLVVVGNLPDSLPYASERRAQIRAAGLESRVHFVGNVDEATKLQLLARAEVFLLTPVTSAEGGFEAFGLVFLEANACGVPTVGIRDSGAQDAILHGETGFLADKGDVAGVASHLSTLLSDRALRDRLGARGRAWAAENNWDRAAGEIEALHRELVGRGAKR